MALSPSQRVALIKESSARLSQEEWPLIDLTLKQFKLPWSDSWSGSSSSYIFSMVEAASDATLIDFARHLGYTLKDAGESQIEPNFWKPGMFRLFISHLASHGKFAGDLQEALCNLGISSFVAHKDIAPTTEWQDQIELGLATCDSLVALLHPDFHLSKWTDQEIGFAMGRQVPVTSIRFGEDPYGFIGRFQAFNGLNKEPKALATELFDAYRKNKQSQRKMSESIITLFAQSGTFAVATHRMRYLEELDVWDEDFPNRITLALNNNSQLSGAWGVPARIEKLLEKWKAS